MRDSSEFSTMSIRKAVEEISAGHYVLPSIQRELVWKPEQMIELFDSLMKGYPISTFLFWKIDNSKTDDLIFYNFVQHYNAFDNTHNTKANVDNRNELIAVLDGQQRMTAMYIALTGSYAYKTRKHAPNEKESYPERKLYLNLLSEASEDDDIGLTYDFRFLTEEEAKNYNEDGTLKNKAYFWFPVYKIMEMNSAAVATRFVREEEAKTQVTFSTMASDLLVQLYETIWVQKLIPYNMVTGFNLDEVLNVFIRVNRSGTALSYSDLLFSFITARWHRDARQAVDSFVMRINNDKGFNINRDFVLKACLVLCDFPNIKFKSTSFSGDNMKTIEANFDELTEAIDIAAELINTFQIDQHSLSSNNLIIPIAYYVKTNNLDRKFVDSTKYGADRDMIRKWLVESILGGLFSHATDGVLIKLREIIGKHRGNFPYEYIVSEYDKYKKDIQITENNIDNLCESEYNDANTKFLLAILCDKLRDISAMHLDHIHPKGRFDDNDSTFKSLSDDVKEYYRKYMNSMLNIQLMRARPNKEKRSSPFKAWFEKTYTSADKKREIINENLLPENIDYGFENFRQFIEERKKLIVAKLKEKLLNH